MLNDVIVNKTSGRLNSLPSSKDHISALGFKKDSLPDGWDIGLKEFNSLKQAESDGITETDCPLIHYQLSEYFRIAESSKIYVFISTPDVTISLDSLLSLTSGEPLQIGYYYDKLGNNQDVINGVAAAIEMANYLENNHAPASVIISGGFTQFTEQLPNLSQIPQSDSRVSVLIAGDADGKGGELAATEERDCIGSIGAVLGAISKASVHECIAWVAKFNMSGAALNKPIFYDGVLLSDKTVGDQITLNDKRYIFFRNLVGQAGIYINDSHTATNKDGDYGYIERNRTINKAVREIRSVLLPSLNSPVEVNENGTLSPQVIASFETKAGSPLRRMQTNGEISAFAVSINPNQDTLTSGQLEIDLVIVPVGVARKIVVKIGYGIITN